MELPNSNRGIFKASYAPILLDNPPVDAVGGNVKASAVLSFAPQSAELKQLRTSDPQVSKAGRRGGRVPSSQINLPSQKLLDAVQRYFSSAASTSAGLASGFSDLARTLTNVPPAEIVALGQSLAHLRSQPPANAPKQAQKAAKAKLLANPPDANAMTTLHAVGVVQQLFAMGQQIPITPVGRLHLERLDMIPAGIERGEFIATVPLAPKETVTIVHKEWSIIKQDFQSIVTDSLVNYSEVGVTEKSELAQSTDSQNKHSSALDLSAQASGGFGSFIQASGSSKLDLTNDDEVTRKDSRNNAQSLTKKASLRTKQEHKVSISTTSVVGKEDTTSRTVTNPSDTNAMRIDYFSMMRKWHVQLYRFGIRMTFDIAIPEPGLALRDIYSQIDEINAQLALPFSFPLSPENISPTPGPNYYADLSAQYNTPLPAPPDLTVPLPVSDTNNPGADGGGHFKTIEFDIQDGYYVTSAILAGHVWGNDGSQPWSDGVGFWFYGGNNWNFNHAGGDVGGDQLWLHGAIGHQKWTYGFIAASGVDFAITITQTVKPSVLQTWQSQCWSALQQGALNIYNAQAQTLLQKRDQLAAQAAAGDTLTLRREEQEEIMKTMLRWLFGPSFVLVPSNIVAMAQPPSQPGGLETIPIPEQMPQQTNMLDWNIVLYYGEVIKFLHNAIEWENVIYFLYPYFWDLPDNWDKTRSLTHPDPTRQAFLRAGSARVVLTVRPGFEVQFAKLMATGAFSGQLPPGEPYVTIAQEIQNYANTNYPGIPPANPSGGSPPDQIATISKVTVPASPNAPVNIAVDDSTGFVVGGVAVIDTAGSGVQEAQIVASIPDKTHVTVKQLTKSHDGTITAFPVVQPGEKGVLIAEWFEYTPTSGTDIAIIAIPPSSQSVDMA
jgi:hypothetical protein